MFSLLFYSTSIATLIDLWLCLVNYFFVIFNTWPGIHSHVLTQVTKKVRIMWWGHVSIEHLGMGAWVSKLLWALHSHAGIIGICGLFEITKVKRGCCTGAWKNIGNHENCSQMNLRVEFVGHPGNLMSFSSSTTMSQCSFMSHLHTLCWLCFLAPCPIPYNSPTHWVCSRSGRHFPVLGHLLFYFLDLNGIGKHNQSYVFY